MRNLTLAWTVLLAAIALICAGCGGSAAYPIGITQPGPNLEGVYHSTDDVGGLGALSLIIQRTTGRPRDEVYEASLRSQEGRFNGSAYGTGTVGNNHAAFDFETGGPGEFYASVAISLAGDQVSALTVELVFPDQAETLLIDFVPVN